MLPSFKSQVVPLSIIPTVSEFQILTNFHKNVFPHPPLAFFLHRILNVHCGSFNHLPSVSTNHNLVHVYHISSQPPLLQGEQPKILHFNHRAEIKQEFLLLQTAMCIFLFWLNPNPCTIPENPSTVSDHYNLIIN